MNWNTIIIDGVEYLEIDISKLRIPLNWDPNSNVFLAVAAPNGGILNHPALAKGDDGDTPDIDTVISFTPLAADDATPDYAYWVETAPNQYKLSLGLHVGADGAPASDTLTPSDFGTATPGRMLVVAPGGSAFTLMGQAVATKSFVPASIASAGSGNAAVTLCAVSCDAQPRDWYPRVKGQTVAAGTGADFRGDLVARLGYAGVTTPETTGAIVARGFGPIGVNAAGIATHFSSARPPGSADSFGKVAANVAATVYIRYERQAGTNTFTTSSDTSIFEVIPDFVV